MGRRLPRQPRVNLINTDLTKAYLGNVADLTSADLRFANLNGVDLTEANLVNVHGAEKGLE